MSGGGTGPATGVARPNVLWISTHDINPDLGAYRGVWPGADAADTPYLDRFAAQGVRFDQAFAAAPVCAPSRSSVITGCFPTSIGTHNMRSKAVPPPEVRLLSEYFRAAGYFVTNNAFTDFQVPLPGTAFDDCSDSAHWRDRPDPEQPFFAIFHGMDTHESQIYLSEDDFDEKVRDLPTRHDPADVPVPPYHPDSEVYRTAWARYHDLVSLMDAWVGGLLADLAADGLERDTIVVFWSDHGAGFPRAKRWATEAGLRIPLILRWPAGIDGGRSRPDVVHLADLAPTMLQLCGLPIPDHMQARPLFGSLGEDLEQGRYAFGGRDRMDEQRDSSRTVRDERFRYVRHRHPDRSFLQWQHFAEKFPTWRELRTLVNDEARQRAAGERPDRMTSLQRAVTGPSKPAGELFDLVDDPHETVNLIDSPEHSDVVIRMSAALDDWIARVGDLGLIDEDELEAAWRPDGVAQVTDAPIATVAAGGIELECSTPGALIGWTTDAPAAEIPDRPLMERISGDPERDGRTWHIYTGALPRSDSRRWARAWRLGFDGSADVALPVEEPVGAAH